MNEVFLTKISDSVDTTSHSDRFERYILSQHTDDYNIVGANHATLSKYSKVTRCVFLITIFLLIINYSITIYNFFMELSGNVDSLIKTDALWLIITRSVISFIALLLIVLYFIRSKRLRKKFIVADREISEDTFLAARDFFSVPDEYVQVGILAPLVKRSGKGFISSPKDAIPVSHMLAYYRDDLICFNDCFIEYAFPIELLVSSELINESLSIVCLDSDLNEDAELKGYDLRMQRNYNFTVNAFGQFNFSDGDGSFIVKVLPNAYHKVLRLISQSKTVY
ncbi:MAG: hypothetical protein LBU04_05500 [Christensenellaceae bacterium]|jgi:hypothetical protein|nr:hypothetical protein [Christensenellaceae bacterium]